MTMPATDFNVPRGSFPTPIKPIGVHPLEPPLIAVAFNFKWCAVIMGCLQQLLLNTTWDVNDQAALTAIQEQVFDLMAAFCANPQPKGFAPNVGATGDEFPMIRQDPDNPCLLQTSIDGTNWCTFADLSKCLTPSLQPGVGSQQPPVGGGTACYQGQFSPSSQFLIPTPVNTGDAVTVQSASGAVSNSHDSLWHLANGNQFFAGLDVGSPVTDGSNPVPSAPTSSLIISFDHGLTWLAIGVGTVVVPSGVSNVQPIIIVNDNSRSLLGGTFDLNVCVQNNAAARWQHTFNFITESGLFVPISPTDGVWTAGSGWSGTFDGVAAVLIIAPRSIAPTTIDQIQAVGNYTNSDGVASAAELFHSGSNVFGLNVAGSSDGFTGSFDTGLLSISPVTVDQVYLRTQSHAGGANSLTKLVLGGTGADPF